MSDATGRQIAILFAIHSKTFRYTIVLYTITRSVLLRSSQSSAPNHETCHADAYVDNWLIVTQLMHNV
jgi:hypothetical protein